MIPLALKRCWSRVAASTFGPPSNGRAKPLWLPGERLDRGIAWLVDDVQGTPTVTEPAGVPPSCTQYDALLCTSLVWVDVLPASVDRLRYPEGAAATRSGSLPANWADLRGR